MNIIRKKNCELVICYLKIHIRNIIIKNKIREFLAIDSLLSTGIPRLPAYLLFSFYAKLYINMLVVAFKIGNRLKEIIEDLTSRESAVRTRVLPHRNLATSAGFLFYPAYFTLITIFLTTLFPPGVMLGLCASDGKKMKNVPGVAEYNFPSME